MTPQEGLVRGKKIFVAVLCVGALALSACGQQTLNLTEEEEQKIVNYSSNVLTSHNANFNSSLKKMSDRQLAEVLKKEMEEQEKKEKKQAEATTAPEEASEEGNGGDSSGTGTSGGGSGEAAENPGIPQASVDQFADLIGLKGFSISYKGYEIVDTYPPESSGSVVFSLEPASATDSLLVINFQITNDGDTEADCNILDLSPKLRFSINGEKHSFLNTLLLDDLQTVDTAIGAHESMDVVLVAEISNEKAVAVKPLSIYVKGSEGSTEIPLE